MSDWLGADYNLGVGPISARLQSLTHRIERIELLQNQALANSISAGTVVYYRKKTFSALAPRPYKDPNVFVILNHEDIVMAPYSSLYFKTELDLEISSNMEATVIGHPIRFTDPPAVIPSHFIRHTPGRGLCLELYNYGHNHALVRRGSPMALLYFTEVAEVTMQVRPPRNMAESPRFHLPSPTRYLTTQPPWIRPDRMDEPPPTYRRHPREEEIAAMFEFETSYDGSSSESSSRQSGPGGPSQYSWGPPTTATATQQATMARSPSYSSLSSETSRLTPLGIRRALETEGEGSHLETGGSADSERTDTAEEPLEEGEEDYSISISAILNQEDLSSQLREDLAFSEEDPAHQPRDDLLVMESSAELPNVMDADAWTRRWVRESTDLLNWVHLQQEL